MHKVYTIYNIEKKNLKNIKMNENTRADQSLVSLIFNICRYSGNIMTGPFYNLMMY